jgi:hypothetical protein
MGGPGEPKLKGLVGGETMRDPKAARAALGETVAKAMLPC